MVSGIGVLLRQGLLDRAISAIAALVDQATGLAVVQGTAMPRDDGQTAGGGSRLLIVEIFTRERGETIIDQWKTELCD